MSKVRANGNTSVVDVANYGEKVEIEVTSFVQGSHRVVHTVTFDHPQEALDLAEEIRRAATAAQIYMEHNPD
jgi:hypothetical protein